MQTESAIATLGWVARARAIAKKTFTDEAANWLAANGAPERARRIFAKAGVPAGSTASSDVGEFGVTSWADTSLQTSSAFFRILADNAFYPAVFNKRVGISSTPATGSIVAEGDAVPLSPVSMQTIRVPGRKAASLIVLTDTLLNDVSSGGQQLLNRELVAAVSAAVDGAFLDMITSTGTTSNASSGNTADDAWSDLRVAMSAVSATGNARLYVICAPDVAVRAATLSTTGGAQVFVAASPSGGELVNVPMLVSSGIPSGTLLVVNAAAIAAAGGPLDVRESRQSAVAMADDPTMDSTTPTGASMVSLWQSNLIGLMATAIFGAQALRDDAVAEITGIAWGGA